MAVSTPAGRWTACDVVLADDGQILIGGAVLFSGYRLRPELTRASLVDGQLATADRGRWVDGRLEVLGRRGRRGDHRRAERRPRRRSSGSSGNGPAAPAPRRWWSACPTPEWGTKIVAVTDGPGDLAELQQLVRRSLPAYAAPRALVQLKRLPRLASGKPDRTGDHGRWSHRGDGDRRARPMSASWPAGPTAGQWLAGARPRTLPAAVAPVVAGSGLAFFDGCVPLGRPPCSPWWSASPCRSGSTTPTTTPTASAAPTPSGSVRCAWSVPAWPRPPRSGGPPWSASPSPGWPDSCWWC